MITVRQLLQQKGSRLWTIHPEASVFEALQLMADKNIGCVLVFDGPRLTGILSERDYARKVILRGKASRETKVREIMTPKVVCVRPDQVIEECLALMTGLRIRHAPVLEDDRIIGMVSIGDVGKALISHQEFVIEQLGHYISGNRA